MSFSEDDGFPGFLRLELQATAELRKRFADCCSAIAMQGRAADVIAQAMIANLGAVTSADLPSAAQHIWQARIVRPLKADTAKPLPPAAIAGIRSWPSVRLGELVAALSEIEAEMATAETDAHNEVIYAEISRAYS